MKGKKGGSPLLISKKYLSMQLGMTHETLAKKVFTDNTLKQLGITRETYKSIRTFDLEMSNKIKNWLGLGLKQT